ncbi:MAG: AAA domain-containing protein [Flavobacteriales bacterium]|nr:AAA domain-containing protein [Flavobacteriales bacterium]
MVAKLNEEIRSYLEHLRELLAIEKQEEYRQIGEYLKNTPLHLRVKTGFSWFPLIIKETGYGLGDYPFVVVERTQPLEVEHTFQGGKLVRLFSGHNDSEWFINGTVHYVDNHQMKIYFFTDDFPDWVNDGKIGVDLLFDDRSYREMDAALQEAIRAKNNRLAYLLNVCFGKQTPVQQNANKISHPYLNASQLQAVQQVLNAEDVAIIHGPPGTGKTTTLVAAITELCKLEKSILVTAPSNAATDHITRELGKEGLKVVRVGNISRIDDQILPFTLEYLLASHSRSGELNMYKKRAEEMRRMAGKYKRSFGKEERLQRELLYKEARALSAEARLLEEYMIEDILQMADVITATPVSLQTKYLENRRFSTVVMDEAAQSLLPATLIPLMKADKLIMAGDPFQLPPTVKSMDAQKGGLQTTLMDICLKTIPESFCLLNVQYRMHQDIMEFSNRWFYKHKLMPHPTVAERSLGFADEKFPPFLFVDTAGTGFEEQMNLETRSLYNEGEIGLVKQILNELLDVSQEGNIPTVAVITPYREQVMKLHQALYTNPVHKQLFSIDTIDSFQGQERDVVIISLVRSNERGEIGFLQDYRRMNVAMTRAKKCLIMIGDSATLANDRFYQFLLNYVEEKSAYRSAWAYIHNE